MSDNNSNNSELIMKLLEGQARQEQQLSNIEGLIKDQKQEVKELTTRVRELEASRNKTLGIALAASFVMPIIVLFIRSQLGG